MNTTTKPVKIQCRAKACNCGCQGQDSWHKPNITRVVRDVVAKDHEVNQEHDVKQVVIATGTAKMPWGEEPVECVSYTWDGIVSKRPEWRLTTLKGPA